MNYELILKNIAKHIDLDKAESDYFTSLLKLEFAGKKEIILKAGDQCKYLNYIGKGAMRAYYLDQFGKESTVMFALTDWWVTDMFCFLNQKPAMMFIEVLEDSFLFQLSKNNMDELLVRVPKFERFFRILMQNAYTREQLRAIDYLSLSAEKRYERFLSKYPAIAGVTTQKQIASYLGITPEHLSSIKKNKSLKIS